MCKTVTGCGSETDKFGGGDGEQALQNNGNRVSRQAAGWLASLLAPGEEFRQPFRRAGEKQQRSVKNEADRRKKGKKWADRRK